jgi:pyruvate,water dikinase
VAGGWSAVKEQTQSAIRLLEALTERAKELTCLYAIEETLKEAGADIGEVCERIIQAIPPGWQFPDICVVKIALEGNEYRSANFEETPWNLRANIVQQDQVVGTISVYYTKEMPAADIGPFLKEEQKLIETVADRINHFLTYEKMKHVFQEWRAAKRHLSETGGGDWEAVLDLIRQTDNALFLRISNKMLNHLCWSGIEEAEALRRADGRQEIADTGLNGADVKGQRLSRLLDFSTESTERIFRIAANHLSSEEILSRIQMWIQEDKLGALLRTVRRRLPLSEVSSSLRRYFFTTREKTYDRYPLAKGLKVLLIECVLSSRVEYTETAKDHVDIEDLYHLLQKVIFSPESHGKLGGKSAGLFLASQIVKKRIGGNGEVSPFRTPKTWYISSDMMLEFIHYNNMDEIIEQKYKDIERVRLEYPHVIDIFRQTVMPPEMVKGLSMALDDFGDSPIVVRSSSLLEDRTGCAFVGQYKSVFLGNQGPREERLRSLKRAVAEVYASNFGPDPIEFRTDGGLLEFSEQMGVMIQEMVGTRVGPYFLPAFSGAARSRIDLRWLPEIKGDGGIVRVIPGLGTRARDRTRDENPVLVLPGHPSASIGGSTEDRVRHAPKRIDVVNLETNSLQTLESSELIRRFGDAYPNAEQIFSLCENGQIRPLDLNQDKPKLDTGELVANFEGLMTRSPFASQIRDLLRTLEENLGKPVEIEFASDGEHIYLLQCRRQCLAPQARPAPIPKDVARDQIVFSTRRCVSNGWVSNITHVLYLDPAAYTALEEQSHRRAVGRAVARLNQLLPKRQFVFVWPDRWSDAGGRSDIKHSDFKNAAVLIDLPKRESTSDSMLSIDIHFLQDVADSGIFYLPVFTDDEGASLDERFLQRSHNVLPELLPEYAHLSGVVNVIDIPRVKDGKVLQVLMNAELGEAVGLLADPEQEIGYPEEEETPEDVHAENYWRWRNRMAEQIAWHLDPHRFGVEGIYVFGSTKNGTAGPASDIDILVHFRGDEAQREKLVQWLEGWSLCLDEINYLRTGYHSGGLLDFHIVTYEDIAKRTSYAVKINAITDAARPLKLKTTADEARAVTDK